jgi:hypothetical protein
MDTLNISITILAIMITLLSVFFWVRQYTAARRGKEGGLLASYEGYSPHEIAAAMMDLVMNGVIQKHVLFNTAPEHDDRAYFESFEAYLTPKNVNGLKQIRGERKDDWN